MSNTRTEVERRKNNQYKVQNDAFVVLRSNDTKIGRIIDISTDGLAFQYIGKESSLDEKGELGIISAENSFYLYNVPCKILSDRKVYKNHPSPISMRRCDIQFEKATKDQRSQLEHFIQNYANGEMKV
jgi:hypothetical protein